MHSSSGYNQETDVVINEADFNTIVEVVQSHNCVPFLGADIGRGVVSAQEMSRLLAGELGYAGPDLPLSEAAQRFELERSRNELVRKMLDWLTGALQPAPIHHLLAELPFNFFFTTAQHTLLEQALKAKSREVDVVVRQEDTAYVDASRTTVVKLLGDVGQPDTLVLTKKDRRRFLKQSPLLADFVKAKLATQTLLFLEYDLAGDELEGILFEVLEGQGKHKRSAYAVWLQPDATLQRYWAEENIRFIDSDCLAALQILHRELSRRTVQQPAHRRQRGCACDAPALCLPQLVPGQGRRPVRRPRTRDHHPEPENPGSPPGRAYRGLWHGQNLAVAGRRWAAPGHRLAHDHDPAFPGSSGRGAAALSFWRPICRLPPP